MAVPDTINGRFDLLVLHAWLVLERVESDHRLAQSLVNELFVNFDEALRHIGTGDIGMNRRLKIMASAFYGRLKAYRDASSVEDLCAAIHRNLYCGVAKRDREIKALAAYAWAARAHLARIDPAGGRLEFGPLPTI